MAQSLGGAVREQRKLLGKNQTWLAQAVGLKQGTISSIELDNHEPPVKTIRKLAAALGVPFDSLIRMV